MYATSENEAADNLIFFLQETLSCVTSAPLIGYQQSPRLRKIFFQDAARLTKIAGGFLYLYVTQVFTVVNIPDKPDFSKPTPANTAIDCLKAQM